MPRFTLTQLHDGRQGHTHLQHCCRGNTHPLKGGFMRASVKGWAPGYAVACAVYSCVEQKATSRLRTSMWKRYVAGLRRTELQVQHTSGSWGEQERLISMSEITLRAAAVRQTTVNFADLMHVKQASCCKNLPKCRPAWMQVFVAGEHGLRFCNAVLKMAVQLARLRLYVATACSSTSISCSSRGSFSTWSNTDASVMNPAGVSVKVGSCSDVCMPVERGVRCCLRLRQLLRCLHASRERREMLLETTPKPRVAVQCTLQRCSY